jgi:pyrroline-5-carboxylate reductase
MRIGIIGLGKMGEAIIQGIGQGLGKKYKIQGTTHSAESAKQVSKELKIKCHTDNSKLVADSDIIILCVKPHQAEKVLRETSAQFRKNQILISICASLTTEQLTAWSKGKPQVIRAMPNTPCLIGEGMTVFSAAPGVKRSALEVAEQIFRSIGRTAIVEESLMDGVTGLSGCGPAYIYLIIEALSDAGVKVGLHRELATLLAAQTMLGSAKMVLSRGSHPAALKDEVTTPAGCTIDGLMALEEGALRVTLIKGVLAAARRSEKLREKA